MFPAPPLREAAAGIICLSLHLICVFWLIVSVYILRCIAFFNSARTALQFLALCSCQLVPSNQKHPSLPSSLILHPLSLSSLTLSENKLYFINVNQHAMVQGIRVMVYMGRCWRRIHYHPRHLLDYKQIANTDNAAVLPVSLMEKFTNGLLKERRKIAINRQVYMCNHFMVI